jgi:hypothetical protein
MSVNDVEEKPNFIYKEEKDLLIEGNNLNLIKEDYLKLSIKWFRHKKVKVRSKVVSILNNLVVYVSAFCLKICKLSHSLIDKLSN